MKLKKLSILVIGLAATYSLTSCSNNHDHDEDEHAEHSSGDNDENHEDHETQDDKDHDTDAHTEHADGDKDGHAEHDHEKIIAGPNGGRVITSVEPHAEFFVTADRKVQIGFVDDDIKAVPAGDQSVSVIAGDRSSPTKLSFVKNGAVLLSDKALPDGNDFPVIVQIKTAAGAATVNEKFNLDLSDCPTCDYKEYACICDH